MSQICQWLKDPNTFRGVIPGSGGAPFVVSGDQWIGYDDIDYAVAKVHVHTCKNGPSMEHLITQQGNSPHAGKPLDLSAGELPEEAWIGRRHDLVSCSGRFCWRVWRRTIPVVGSNKQSPGWHSSFVSVFLCKMWKAFVLWFHFSGGWFVLMRTDRKCISALCL